MEPIKQDGDSSSSESVARLDAMEAVTVAAADAVLDTSSLEFPSNLDVCDQGLVIGDASSSKPVDASLSEAVAAAKADLDSSSPESAFDLGARLQGLLIGDAMLRASTAEFHPATVQKQTSSSIAVQHQPSATVLQPAAAFSNVGVHPYASRDASLHAKQLGDRSSSRPQQYHASPTPLLLPLKEPPQVLVPTSTPVAPPPLRHLPQFPPQVVGPTSTLVTQPLPHPLQPPPRALVSTATLDRRMLQQQLQVSPPNWSQSQSYGGGESSTGARFVSPVGAHIYASLCGARNPSSIFASVYGAHSPRSNAPAAPFPPVAPKPSKLTASAKEYLPKSHPSAAQSSSTPSFSASRPSATVLQPGAAFSNAGVDPYAYGPEMVQRPTSSSIAVQHQPSATVLQPGAAFSNAGVDPYAYGPETVQRPTSDTWVDSPLFEPIPSKDYRLSALSPSWVAQSSSTPSCSAIPYGSIGPSHPSMTQWPSTPSSDAYQHSASASQPRYPAVVSDSERVRALLADPYAYRMLGGEAGIGRTEIRNRLLMAPMELVFAMVPRWSSHVVDLLQEGGQEVRLSVLAGVKRNVHKIMVSCEGQAVFIQLLRSCEGLPHELQGIVLAACNGNGFLMRIARNDSGFTSLKELISAVAPHPQLCEALINCLLREGLMRNDSVRILEHCFTTLPYNDCSWVPHGAVFLYKGQGTLKEGDDLRQTSCPSSPILLPQKPWDGYPPSPRRQEQKEKQEQRKEQEIAGHQHKGNHGMIMIRFAINTIDNMLSSTFGSICLAECFKNARNSELRALEEFILSSIHRLAKGKYSSYFLQKVLQHGSELLRERIAEGLMEDIVGLMVDRCGRFVVETCFIRTGSLPLLQRALHTLQGLPDDRLAELVKKDGRYNDVTDQLLETGREHFPEQALALERRIEKLRKKNNRW
ncbi:hypothetical protein ACP70R_016620 [Stipagrostis hirtigluma subsp. patula]